MSRGYNPNGFCVVEEKRAVYSAFSVVLLLSSQFELDVQRRRIESRAEACRGRKMSTSTAGRRACIACLSADEMLVSSIGWLPSRTTHPHPPVECRSRELDLSRLCWFRFWRACDGRLCWKFACSRTLSLEQFVLNVVDMFPSRTDPLTMHDE